MKREPQPLTAIIVLRCTMDEFPLRTFVGENSFIKAKAVAMRLTEAEINDEVDHCEVILRTNATGKCCLAVYTYDDQGKLDQWEVTRLYE